MKIDGNISIFLAHVLLKSSFYNFVRCKVLLFWMQIDTEIAIDCNIFATCFIKIGILPFTLVENSTILSRMELDSLG